MHRLCEVGPSRCVAHQDEVLYAQDLDGSSATSLPVDIVPIAISQSSCSAPNGSVTFVSSLFQGSVSDKEITRQSGILNLLEEGAEVMADKGFLIEDLLKKGKCNIGAGADPGEVKWVNFHPPSPAPFSKPPFLHRPRTPQPGFGSITLLQKFTPHFKILDPRLR